MCRKIIGCALLLLGLEWNGSVGAKDGPPLKVLCSFYPMYVMALNVARNVPGVELECMTEATTGCLHDYQLSPSDLKAIGAADIFIANGAGMETFIEKALAQSPRLKVIEASKGIKLEFNENPHVWLSVGGAIRETRNIAAGLAAADPTHAKEYASNAEEYVTRLEGLRRQMHAALDGLKHRDIITFHEAFPYFAAEFNLKVAAVVEREPGSEPSAGELAKTIQMVRATGVKAIFAEPQYPAKSADIIHRETGVPVRALDPAVTGPRDPARARDSYIHTMEENLKVLAGALRD
jgi:zinc transport system substrate-binding protein